MNYFNHFTFSSLITAIATFILGVFVLFKGRFRKLLYIIFALYSFSIAWWSLCATKFTPDFQDPYLIWGRLLHLGAILIPALFIHFVFEFLEEKNKKVILLCYLITGMFLGFNFFTRLFIKGITNKTFYSYPTPSIIYPFYFAFFAVCVLFGLYKLFRASLITTGARRNQIKYLLWSSLFGYIGGFKNFMILVGLEIFPIYPYGTYAIPIYVLVVTIAIIKYRLMDITVLTVRGLIFSGVYLFILGIPFWIGYKFLGEGLWMLPVSIMAVFATLGPFIYNYFRRRAENVVLKEQHRYQETLRKLSATLTLVKDLNRLLKLVVLRGARAVKVDFACIYLANENKLIQKYPYTIKGFFPDFPKEISFDSNIIRYILSKRRPVFAEELLSMTDGFSLRSGLIVPSFVRKRLLGFLVLGPKTSGTIYTQEDANMFGILANQLALAIENSQFIDEHERTQAEFFSRERMASLGTMAGGMTHQINNRFNAISMATSDTIDTLKFIDLEKATKEELKDRLNQIAYALNRIQENALRGGKLVNDFLNFSQPDRLQKEAKIFNLPEPLERGIEMVRIKTAFSEDTIQKEIQKSPLLIRGSFEMIQDVYFNITDNAIDALDKKDKAIQKKELSQPESGYKGKIVIRMYREEPWVVTKIQDNGIGMTEEQTEKLFTPFFTTKATAVKGTGLGLFVIYKIIEAHGGSIEVESEYGKGTIFTIKLPLAKEEEENNEP